MRFLKFFDYIFFRLAYFYTYHLEYIDIRDFASVVLLSIFQCVNILFILFLIFLNDLNNTDVLLLFALVYVVVLGLNFYRYKKIKSFDSLEEKWKDESRKTKKIKFVVIFSYAVLSIIFLSMIKKFN